MERQINEKSFIQRLEFGNNKAKQMAEVINKKWGCGFEPVPTQVDVKQFVDYISTTFWQEPRLAQFKVRVSGHDLGFAVREPFCRDFLRAYKYILPEDLKRPLHQWNREGRDILGEYHYFVCLDRNEEWIRFVKAERAKWYVNDVMQRWSSEPEYKIYKGKSFYHDYPEPDNTSQSRRVEIRHVIDRGTDEHGSHIKYPKIIVYVPPELLKKKTEIIYLPFKSNSEKE